MLLFYFLSIFLCVLELTVLAVKFGVRVLVPRIYMNDALYYRRQCLSIMYNALLIIGYFLFLILMLT